MTDHSPPTRREDFKIAVICALSIEGDAVEALFDKIWDDEDCALGKEQTDRNTYTMGVIGHHNVVLTWMRGIGKVSAARAATDLENSFKGIKLSLVVGICGGVPHTSGGEILLGDVIVSTGINQYDFGKQLPGKILAENADTAISSFLSKLQGTRGRRRLTENTLIYLKELLGSGDFQTAQYPGANEDKLYKATYRHEHHELSSCDSHICGVNKDGVCDKALDSSCVELKCDERELLPRDQRMERASGGPLIHFGLVASGDTVMKSGEHRDEIAAAKNVIAFEMEGAGVWDTFEYVFVIKGVCDYADSHKNKKWQRYAALTGAACMKALLKESMFLGKPSQAKEIASKP
jgi:nucleoside phosphorylase